MFISFHAANIPSVPITNRTFTRSVLADLFESKHKKIISLKYIFTTDEYLLNLNQTFLQHDYYTDVITFDLSEKPGEILGEVYISAIRVKENALKEKVTFKQEMMRVVIHGALHLCGYSDKTKSEIRIMREQENEYLRFFKI